MSRFFQDDLKSNLAREKGQELGIENEAVSETLVALALALLFFYFVNETGLRLSEKTS